MYMAPIVAARPAAAKPAASPLLRAAVGLPVLLVSLAVMLPWLAVNGLFSAIVIGGLVLLRGPRALVQAIDYAGRIALGR